MGVVLVLSSVPMWFLINTVDDETNVGKTGIIAVLTGILAIIPVPIERAITANICLPETRGRANSFLGIVDDLGKGLGPVFVSLLIDAFGRQTAFNASLLGWIIGGILSCFLYCTVKGDEARVQELVRQSIEQASCPVENETFSTHPLAEECVLPTDAHLNDSPRVRVSPQQTLDSLTDYADNAKAVPGSSELGSFAFEK
jgi:MFS family permease